MAFDWRTFLDLARALQSSFSTLPLREAASRSAVSRAYYAAFCYTRAYAAENLGFQRIRSSREHSELRNHLGQQGPEWKEISDKLKDLHEWRKLCDYEDTVDNLDIMVSNAISTADNIISSLWDNHVGRQPGSELAL